MKQERMWVHPEFKKRIRIEAAEKGVSILKLTKTLGEENNVLQQLKKKHEKSSFRFRI